MKNRLKTVVAFGVAVMVVAGMVSFAHAGGAINWKVKVANQSDHDVEVELYYNAGGSDSKRYRISKGSSHTFETGAKCPFGLEGWVYDLAVTMVTKCINGHANTKMCGVVCADSDWKITKHTDGAYHFDRD